MKKQFGTVTVPDDLKWFIVEEFLLPAGVYNREYTRLLHLLNPAYPQTPPDNFLVPAGLRTATGHMPGKGYKEGRNYLGEEWGIFSWHAEQWNPAGKIADGDNLLTFLCSVEKRLQEGGS
ncbi:MAG: E2/UBC family protein [bacterium]